MSLCELRSGCITVAVCVSYDLAATHWLFVWATVSLQHSGCSCELRPGCNTVAVRVSYCLTATQWLFVWATTWLQHSGCLCELLSHCNTVAVCVSYDLAATQWLFVWATVSLKHGGSFCELRPGCPTKTDARCATAIVECGSTVANVTSSPINLVQITTRTSTPTASRDLATVLMAVNSLPSR